MCGRFNSNHHLIGWDKHFNSKKKSANSFNVSPKSEILAFRNESGEKMRWGLIPSWADTFESEYATFNARVETVNEKATFRDAWRKSQRCLIPMGGYYEWKGQVGDKKAYYVTDSASGGLVVAGLYDSWNLDRFLSCTILTRPADRSMADLHPRLPILLSPETAKDWMSCADDLNIESLLNLPRPKVSFYEVGKIVGNPDVDAEHLIEPKRI